MTLVGDSVLNHSPKKINSLVSYVADLKKTTEGNKCMEQAMKSIGLYSNLVNNV